MEPYKTLPIGVLLKVQVVPSDEVITFPEAPTAVNLSFEKPTPYKAPEIGVLLRVQSIPLEEVTTLPEAPTATKVLFAKVIS